MKGESEYRADTTTWERLRNVIAGASINFLINHLAAPTYREQIRRLINTGLATWTKPTPAPEGETK